MPIPYLLLALGIVVVDQIVKYLVRANIALGEHLDFIPGLLDLTFVQNTGAAFSILEEQTWLLTVLSAVVSVVILIALWKNFLPHWSGKLALGLLLGGAVGNLIDRALLGYVTDMFATTFMNFPVFNVADIGVVIGGFLLVFHVLVFMKDDDKKEEDPA